VECWSFKRLSPLLLAVLLGTALLRTAPGVQHVHAAAHQDTSCTASADTGSDTTPTADASTSTPATTDGGDQSMRVGARGVYDQASPDSPDQTSPDDGSIPPVDDATLPALDASDLD
jgi:hypothetical protein